MSSLDFSPLGRRGFLTGGLSLLGGAAMGSPLIRNVARMGRLADTPRTLVMLQLSGGNDGLSTIVPYGDDAYGAARQSIRLGREDVFALDDYRGMHKGLVQLHREYQAGRMAIVEGVGYEQMIRSHFRALEVWHTGRWDGRASGEGWISRLAQAAWQDEDHPNLVVHLGQNAPYSLYSTTHPAASLESPTVYKWFGESQVDRAYGMSSEHGSEGAEKDPRHLGRDRALAQLRGVLNDAHDSSQSIRRAAALYRERVEYPRNRLAGALRDVAALINGRLGTRVFSMEMGGFDTHAGQRGNHDTLMETLDSGLGAFLADLSTSDAGRSTVVLVFSEFGRRVRENGSKGTDHGKAGPMFLLGPSVKGGLYGKHPSLTELDEGDLVATTDFRSVYGAIIQDWFGVPHQAVLGKPYELLPLLG